MINNNQDIKHSETKSRIQVSNVKNRKEDTPGVARFRAEKAARQREIHVLQEDSDNALERVNALFDELKKQYNL